MPTRSSSAHTILQAIATLTPWLPYAPHDPTALAEEFAARLSAALPTLPISLAVQQHGAWLLHGSTTPAAQQWITTLDVAVAEVISVPQRPLRSPTLSATLVINDVRVAIAVWKRLAKEAWAALTALIELAFSAQQAALTPSDRQGQEYSAEIAALRRIGHALNTTLNLDVVLPTVLQEARTVTSATYGAVALHTADGRLQYVITRGYAEDAAMRVRSYTLGSGDSSADRAVREGQPIMHGQHADLVIGLHETQGSSLDVPIRYQEHVVGLISLRSAAQKSFRVRQLEFMRLVADQAAVAIGNAQHVIEQQRQRELLQQRAIVLNEVLEVGHLIRADRPLPDMLNDIAYGIVNAVGFRSVIINLLDEADPQMFRPTAFAGVLPEEMERIRKTRITLALLEQLCQPEYRLSDSYFLPDQAVRNVFGAQLHELTTSSIVDERAGNEWQPDDMFLTPLHNSSGAIIGFMSVDDPFDRRRPTRRMAEALEIFAYQTITAIDNVRLYNAAERRLHEAQVINQLAQALAAPIGLDELAEVLYVQLSRALKANSVQLAMYDRGSDVLDFPLVVEQHKRKRVDAQRGVQGTIAHVLHTKTPLLLNGDIAAQLQSLGITPTDLQCRSFAGVPLLVGDDAVGVLFVQDHERDHAFEQHELELLQAIALQTAAGIEKARLLQQRERQIAQMQTLNNIGKIASSTLLLHDLFIDMFIELNRYRETDILLLAVCDPQACTIKQMIMIDKDELHVVEDGSPIKPNSYTDLILRTDQPLLLRNAPEEEPSFGLETYVIGTGDLPLSCAGVPLRDTSGQPFGILSMQSYNIGEYDVRDIDFLTNVAQQIALNIQNATLFKQSQQQVAELAAETERLELINRVSNWSNARLDVDELLQRAVHEMARVTNADQARLMLIDRARSIAVCQSELHDTGAVGTLIIPTIGNPAIEWADQHGTSMLVLDAPNDPRFAPIHDVLRAEQIRDVLIVPLIVKGEVIGTVGLDAKAREHSFTPRDVATCETIANQMAIVLENTRLWNTTQQSVRELTMLYDLSVSLTTMLDLDEILYTVVGAALEIEHAALSAITLFDRAERISRFAAMTRAGDELDQASFEHNPALLDVMRSGALRVFDDCTPQTCTKFDAHTESSVVVPIVVKGQAIGCLVVAAYQARSWTERAQSMLTILTTQAATAIENAYLFRSEQEKRQLADTLREVAVALTATLDINDVLQIVLVQVQRFVPYTRAVVQMARDDQHFEIVLQRDADGTMSFEPQATVFAPDDVRSPVHHIRQTQQPFVVNDAQAEFPALQTNPRTGHIRSWIGVPLVHGNQLLGLIALEHEQAHFFTSEMADLALMFATQAAQAIAHARLFAQIRQFNTELEQKVSERTAALTAEKERLEAVHAITTALTASLDIDEIVLKTLELAAGAIGVRRGSVLIRDPMRDQLFYRAVLSETEGLLAVSEPFDLPPGNLVQWTLEDQRGVYIDDVQTDERWVRVGHQNDDIRSFIAVPLLAADVPLGVLMLNSRQVRFFNEEHLRLLSTIASEVAIAIHNAELYNFINEQATRLAELLQQQREETGKNRAVLESVAEGVLVLDEQNTIVLYNRAANDVLRTGSSVVAGGTFNEIAAVGTSEPEQQRALMLFDALNEGVHHARGQNDSWHRVVELPGQTIDTTFTPVTTPDGERIGVAAVLRDITREIEADKTKREFIATVSHELRTPLTSVKGYVDLLLLGTIGSVTDMQRNFLQVIKSNADRLNALVEDLLEISRLENGKVKLNVKPLALPSLINEIVTSLRTETERKRMNLVLEIDPALPIVEADNKRISQVLTNLLSNAHKYTRDGGQITVRAFQQNNFVQIDVADTGVGIPPDELPKMFSRFFRTNNALKDEVGGTGLGLSIAKSFVELHGGAMWVTSELEVGSTFSFNLPIEYQPQFEAAGDMLVGAA